jgi:drug/metabolite transporter (DMT)-like permease
MTGVATFLAGTERPSARFFAGSLVALGGIAVIYADRMTTSSNQALGVALVFASVVVCAVYTMILKRHASDTDPLATNLPFLGAAAVSLLLFAAAHERQLPPWPPAVRPTLALLYLAVFGSVVTFALYFHLLRRMSLTAASTLVFVEPVLALLIDAAFEREIRLGPRTHAGAAVTLLGVAISLLLRPRPKPGKMPA